MNEIKIRSYNYREYIALLISSVLCIICTIFFICIPFNMVIVKKTICGVFIILTILCITGMIFFKYDKRTWDVFSQEGFCRYVKGKKEIVFSWQDVRSVLWLDIVDGLFTLCPNSVCIFIKEDSQVSIPNKLFDYRYGCRQVITKVSKKEYYLLKEMIPLPIKGGYSS